MGKLLYLNARAKALFIKGKKRKAKTREQVNEWEERKKQVEGDLPEDEDGWIKKVESCLVWSAQLRSRCQLRTIHW